MKIPEEKIEENLKNIELGKDLTLNLAVLNGEFKKRYFKCKECGKPISEWSMTGYCTKCYYKSEELKKKIKEYHQKPEIKERLKEYRRKYYQKPEIKERMKEYRQRPEVKKRMREYIRKYRQRKKKEKKLK